MSHYRYLIIGGGMTADSAVQGIRELDSSGTIGLVGEEPEPPYDRPPLSKGLWKGKTIDQIWRRTESYQVDLHLGCRAETIDVKRKRITDDQGAAYTFDKLLLAMGGRPRRLPYDEGQIIYYRTVADFRRLQGLAERGRRFVVIGGGFIGSEIAAALALNGKKVTMIFPELGIGGLLFPHDLSDFLNDFYRLKGVEVLTGESVAGLTRRGEQSVLRTSSREIVAEGVIAGIGIEPNIELAQQAGLELDNGIVVDELLRTSRADIYAAGDVASFYNPALGKRLRVEHEDNANTMGRFAGRNMAGDAKPYHYLPYFYSDLFELGYEAVGGLDARLQTVSDWEDPFQKGVIYYLRHGRVRGVLLWNVWEQVEAARNLIATDRTFRPEDLIGRLPAATHPAAAGQT